MIRSVNVKKTKSSKKIVLKITMSMTGTIVDECSVLRTQVESMGDNLCRSGLRKKLLDSFLLISS